MTHHTDAERPWWRDRANEIEVLVGAGKMDAMACYTQMLQLLDADRRAAAAPVPQGWPTNEMIEAGRKAANTHGPLLGNGQSLWHIFRDMLAAAPQPPEAEDLGKKLQDAQRRSDFFKRRCDLLQIVQRCMRDPERTLVCDVLANGHLLHDVDSEAGKARYLAPEAAPVQLPEPSAWMFGCKTGGGSVGWKLSWSKPGAGVCHRLSGEEFEQPLYTEQQVRELLAAHGIQERST
jgi:hypothetical protein